MTTDEKIQEVIRRISEGSSARAAIKELGMSQSTFFGAVLDNEEIQKQYARAMDIRAAIIFDQIEEIADDSSGDELIDDKGNVRQNNEFIQRSKLRVDARKWMLARMNPKKYSDKISIDHTTQGNKMDTPVPPWMTKAKPEDES